MSADNIPIGIYHMIPLSIDSIQVGLENIILISRDELEFEIRLEKEGLVVVHAIEIGGDETDWIVFD